MVQMTKIWFLVIVISIIFEKVQANVTPAVIMVISKQTALIGLHVHNCLWQIRLPFEQPSPEPGKLQKSPNNRATYGTKAEVTLMDHNVATATTTIVLFPAAHSYTETLCTWSRVPSPGKVFAPLEREALEKYIPTDNLLKCC